jgi:hypothetical protein
MEDTDPAGSHSDPVREEAVRLVTAAVAGLSLAVRSIPGVAEHSFANDSPECCVCPICRVVAAMRDPSPELTERLAGGAGDIAVAVANALRGLAKDWDQVGSARGRSEDAWRDATRTAAPRSRAPSTSDHTSPSASDHTDPSASETGTSPVRKVAKKAVAKKAVSKSEQPQQSSASDRSEE